MAIDAEQLNIILTAQTKGMRTELERAQKRISGFEKSAKKSLSATTSHFDTLATGVKTLLPILTAAFSVQAFKGALQAAVDIENLSNIAGVATDQFQVLALTSQQFGIGQEKLSDILKDVNDKFGDYVQTGAGPLADFFTNIAPKVGLTAAAFADLSSDQKLGAYINALEKANVSQADMTFYMEAIASDSTALVQAFTNNSQAISEMERKAAELGLILDQQTIAKAREAKAELDLMAQVINIDVTNALLAIAPLAIQAAAAFSQISQAIAEFFNVGGNGLVPLVDTESMKQDYLMFQEFHDAIRKAENDLNGRLQQTEVMNDPPTIPELDALYEQLDIAEKALDVARERKAVEEAGRASADAAVQTIERETASLKEQAELNKLTAQEVERRKIATERLAYEQQILNGILASGQKITEDARQEAEWLGAEYELAAIGASKILNPIEKTNTAARSTAASVQEVNTKLSEMSPLLTQLGFDAEKLQSVANIVESSMESAFMGIVDGTMTAKDAFRSMASDIIKELFRVLVVQRLVGGITSALGLSAPSSVSGMASGGTLQAGQPAVVGEHGRELFVPSSAGRVLSVPQAKAAVGGGGTVVVNQTINVSTGVQQTVRAEIKSLMPQIAESAKAAVVDAKRRGGSYGRAFS
jgi:hypothetical protein